MIILSGNKIERSFAGQVLFENISLQIDEKDRIALVGKNGAGKSTLLKILVGEETPTSGEVQTKRDLSLSYLAQNSRFMSDRTIYEEMLQVFAEVRTMEASLRELEEQMAYLAGQELEEVMARYDSLSERFRQAGGFHYEADIRSMLQGFQFDQSMWEMKISDLSGGQNTRLALAKMLLEGPDLLILDEPTNHLDMETIAWLEQYLQHYKGALLIVSHDRYFLDKVATITLDLTKHSLDRYVGNYSQFVAQKEQRLLTEWQQYEKQQKQIAKLEDFVQKNIVRASTTKRAQSRRKQLEKMDRLDKPQGEKKAAHMTFQARTSSGNVVLTVEQAAVGYGRDILSQPLTFEVRKFDAIAIVGPNGIGKTTLLKSIMGHLPFIKGETRKGANVEIGYYDQTQSSLSPSQSVLEALWSAFPNRPELDIRNRLGAFLFSGEEVKKSVSMLSGGEKARLLLAKLSMEETNFLLLDEPTNHLDIESKEVLEEALIAFDGTLLFVSHDRYFINRVATKVLEISETGTQLYLGDYDYYLEKKAEQSLLDQEQTKESEPSLGALGYQSQKEGQKEQRKRARRIQELEDQIDELDQRLSAIQSSMEATNEIGQLTDLQREMEQMSEWQEACLLEWEDLSSQLD